ncbi:hypothetical protein PMAYCL1PPCAC_31277, partial [Pristionchus mayeri]
VAGDHRTTRLGYGGRERGGVRDPPPHPSLYQPPLLLLIPLSPDNMGGLMNPLLGILLVATVLVAQEQEEARAPALPYPESYAYKPYDAAIAHAKAMSPDCPMEGYTQCPTPNFQIRTKHWPCVRYSELCNGKNDCPQGEDEHPSMCMYHKMLDDELDRIRKVIDRAHVTH